MLAVCAKKKFRRKFLRIRIRLIRNILASWIRIRKNMRIQGAKYQPKTAKNKNFTLKTQVWTIEKREIIKISWFLNGSSSLSIKICEKNKDKKFRNFALLKKFSKFLRNILDLDPDPYPDLDQEPFFFSADPGSGSA